jgi:hypothetical protein
MLPNALQLYFRLEFDNGSGIITTETLGGALEKTVALLPGTYTLAVFGYSSPYEAENGGTPVVNGGAASFPVETGTNPDVAVNLTAAQNGTGTLRYTLTYPTNPAVSGGRIYVEQLGGPYTKLIIPEIWNDGRTSAGTLPNLSSGYYQVTVYLSNGRIAIKSDLAHIYDGLETDANFVFDLSSFADVADLSPLKTAITAAKAAASDVRISADGAGITAGHTWVPQTALDALNDAIALAETITANYGAGLANTAVNVAATALNAAVFAFNSACVTVGGDYTPGANLGLYVGASPIPEPDAGTTLASALAWLKDNAVSDTEYTVLLGDDETLPPWELGGSSGTNMAFNGLTGVTLVLRGDTAERVIQLSEQGSLFIIHGGITLILDQNITLRGRSDNNTSLVEMYGALEMKAGAKIIGNTASSNYSGGGVRVSYGTFTMSGGEISDNTASSDDSGGGVYVGYDGTFTMSSGEIRGNTASSYSGGGVRVFGTFTMSGGEISGNIASSYSGGGVRVSGGTFTMSGGEISGNTASSNDSGGGVYVDDNGTFAMSGNGQVAQDNPVYLVGKAAIRIDGALSGTDPIAFIEVPADLAWIGKEVIKKSASFADTLPVDRFGFTGPWEADSDGRFQPKAVSLDFGETRSAFINRGGVHLYRFTPAFNKSYSITCSMPSHDYYGYYDGVYVSAVWADGSGTLANRNYYPYYSDGITPSFVADRTGVDIIIMVDSSSYSDGYTGVYTVNYNELE